MKNLTNTAGALLLATITMLASSGAQEMARGPISGRKPLTDTELYSVARRISVQVLITDDHKKLIPAGSGVWISDGIVATCHHVLKDSAGPVAVSVHVPDDIDLPEHRATLVPSVLLKSSILASDLALDIALLQVDPTELKKLRDQKTGQDIAVADLEKNLPESGSNALLAGYPLGGPVLLARRTGVAGVGVFPDSSPGASALNQVRIFIGISGTLGDSGGPVLNQFGKVIGIVQGNLNGPFLNEDEKPVIYVRPVLDSAANIVQEPDGKPKFEATELFGRSGIAAVVPAYFVSAMMTAHSSTGVGGNEEPRQR